VNYKIEFVPEARKNLKSLDNSIRKPIKKLFDKLERAEDPRAFGKPLEKKLAGYWRYRVESYRIIAEILDDKLVVYVISIGHRSTIYDKLNKRLNK